MSPFIDAGTRATPERWFASIRLEYGCRYIGSWNEACEVRNTVRILSVPFGSPETGRAVHKKEAR